MPKTNSASIRTKRIFVLDTNVLLHDCTSLFAFKGVVVVIPFVVLEELDTFKKDNGELGRNARAVIRTLDELREQGSLNEGVELNHGTKSILRVTLPANPFEQPILVNSTARDNAILKTVQNLTKKGYEVTLVTKDINARVKADSLKLDAEDYTAGAIVEETFYKGWTRIPVPSMTLKTLSPQKVFDFLRGEEAAHLNPNEFVIVESENNPDHNRIFRFLGGKVFKEVLTPQLRWSFTSKNIQQRMALDVLLDDDIKLVSLIGPAGTGKTFLALLAGLQKVVSEKIYRRLLVTRPIVALGADIGYLPGDVQEKLHNWMKPIHDNLDYIFTKKINRGEPEEDEEYQFLGSRAKDRRHQRRHPIQEQQGREIELLQQKNILNMEAITYMRGRSIPDQFIFIDEVQNLTPHEVKTIVSRAGEGSKVILAGDPHQIDSPYLDFTSNGLTITAEKLKSQPIAATVYLDKSERSRLADIAARIL